MGVHNSAGSIEVNHPPKSGEVKASPAAAVSTALNSEEQVVLGYKLFCIKQDSRECPPIMPKDVCMIYEDAII